MFKAFAIAALILIVPGYQIVMDDWTGAFAMPSLFAYFGLLFVWFLARTPITDYQSSVAYSIYPKILKFYGDEFSYVEKSKFFVHSLKASGIIPTYDKEKTTHKISGSHNNAAFTFAHSCLSRTSGESGDLKDKNTTILFSGTVFLISLPKALTAKTIIQSDAGRIGNWFAKKRVSELARIPFDDTNFEKTFQVYSSNETEARQLLSERLIQRLIDIEKQFDGKKMACSFYDNNMLIMITSKRSKVRASSIYKPATFEQDANTLRTQISEIFQIIETLDLEQNTYHLPDTHPHG